MSTYWHAAFVFFAAFLTDAVWAYYIKHAAREDAWRTSLSGSLIVLLGGFITVEYVGDRRLLLVAACGGFLGSFLIVKFNRKRDKNSAGG